MAPHPSRPDSDTLKRWFDTLAARDPQLHEELARGMQRRAAVNETVFEAVGGGALNLTGFNGPVSLGLDPQQLPPRPDIILETMVREGRPALPIFEDRIRRDQPQLDAVARALVTRLMHAADTIEPLIPLVGRIDVANHPLGLPFLGTGWVFDTDGTHLIIVTNRHVAELMVQADPTGFEFRPGRFGQPLDCAIDYLHELGRDDTAAATVRRVLWMESDPNKADIALLQADLRPGARDGGRRPLTIPLAPRDAAPNTDVVVIGYPARASVDTIPNQAWMDRVYESTYDVKRIAPGMTGDTSRGWATHDCTTLGGCSGGVVLDLTGQAVALHFAGLYMIENYAVPVSTLNAYRRDEVWRPASRREGRDGNSSTPATPVNAGVSGSAGSTAKPGTSVPPASIAQTIAQAASAATISADGRISVTIPLHITVSLGQPTFAAPGAGLPAAGQPPAAGHPAQGQPAAGQPGTGQGAASGDGAPAAAGAIERAAIALRQAHRVEGLLAVRPGYLIAGNRLTDTDCLVASAHPDRFDVVRGALPASFAGYPVDVRRASVADQVAGTTVDTEAVTRISYNDEDRTGPEFSFDPVDEEMAATLHVGPERSWSELRAFLDGTRRELISSMYEFHAAHVADAVEQELKEGATMELVVARNSRDPVSGTIPAGDFDRSERFEAWREQFGERFSHIFVPVGSRGLVANSYHIKVTVRDRRAVWLSSGNWKRASQPLIADADRDNPARTNRAGNREWHVILDNRTLAARFRSHIREDFAQSGRLGGTTESPADPQVLVDVPIGGVEGVGLEAAPTAVLEPLSIERRLRVKPLLTPDRQGAVYCDAVLALIASARTQLLFQNQYIKMDGAGDPRFGALVEALAAKARDLRDCRIILRNGDSFASDVEQLKRRGVPVDTCVRRLPNTHTKGIIVDGRRVLVGSHNWSASGVTLNRDASLIFDDQEVAQYFARAFELDWQRAPELSLRESVELPGARVADPGSPVPAGFVRMTLSEYLEG